MRRDVFQAIADPTRRQIINLVAHKSLNFNSVAEQFPVSRPAISKHIKILTECGLVVINQKGRERFCEAKVEKLTEVSDWVEQFREMWEAKFDSLDKYLAEVQAKQNEPEIKEKKALPKKARKKETQPKQIKTKKAQAKPEKQKTKPQQPEEDNTSSVPDNQYSLF